MHAEAVGPSRRSALVRMALAGAGIMTALPARARRKRSLRPPPGPSVHVDVGGTRARGPFGELRCWQLGGQLLPVYVTAAAGAAVMDCRGPTPIIRFDDGAARITLTPEGLRFGRAPIRPWSRAELISLAARLRASKRGLQGALHLRAALHTLLPAALRASKLSGAQRVGRGLAQRTAGLGSTSMMCTTRTVTETVEREVTQLVDQVLTAQQQVQACYARELSRAPCRDAWPLRELCAAGLCAQESFVDLVVGVVAIVDTVVEEVVREVVTCALPKPGEWPNPWTIIAGGPADFLPGTATAAAAPTPASLGDALALLRSSIDFLGPFANCLLAGTWTLAALPTPLALGGEQVTVPYGVRVCIDAACAEQLALDNTFGITGSAWSGALAALAALSPAFAADMGVAPSAAMLSLLATLAPAVAAVVVPLMAIILAFVVLALIYASALSAQFWLHQSFTDHFADGVVCIEHPTFALALIKVATWSLAPAELIPPMVVG